MSVHAYVQSTMTRSHSLLNSSSRPTQMAARESSFGAAEAYMHQGKLLALDLLARVLGNPMHDWSQVRRGMNDGVQPHPNTKFRNMKNKIDEVIAYTLMQPLDFEHQSTSSFVKGTEQACCEVVDCFRLHPQVRPEFAAELRQPLCLALLRNCLSPFDAAYGAAVKLFNALAAAGRLRAGLKAELGALLPLVLLRSLEGAKPESGV